MTSSLARRLGRALASAVALALVLPATAQAFVFAPTVTLTGTYTLVHVDGRPGHADRDSYRPVLRIGNRAYDVSLRKGMAFRSGDTVKFGGHLAGRTLQADSAHIQTFAADNLPVAGTTKVLVILAYWTAPDSMTVGTAQNTFASDDSWFQQTSYGHLGLDTTVAQSWVQVATPTASVCTSSTAAYQLTNDAVAGSGYSAGAFDRVVVYFPGGSAGCSGIAGFAEVPGNHVWLNGTMDVRSTVHEQGHNYGLYHAHSAVCTTPGTTTPTVAPDAAADNCSFADYGDPFDAMGASNYAAEYSASQKTTLGWLDAGRTATLPATGSVTLVPYEQQSALVHAASYVASSTRTYWFEWRSATGPDSTLPAGGTGGVLVHINDTKAASVSNLSPSWATPQSFLLDQSPADKNLTTSVLPYGSTWTSPEGDVFTVGVASAGTLTVTAAAPASAGGSGTGGTGGTGSGGGTPTTAPPTVTPPTSAPPTVTTPPVVTPAPAQLAAHLNGGTSTTTVSQGVAVTILGNVMRTSGASTAGLPVVLQASPHGTASWRTVANVTTAIDGTLKASVRPAVTSDYRWQVAASATEAGSVSNLVTVVVRPYVVAAASHTMVKHGHVVGLDVYAPGQAGQVVQVQRWSHNAWHPYATVRLGANQRRVVSVRLAAKGTYQFRFVIAANADHLVGTSKTLKVKAT